MTDQSDKHISVDDAYSVKTPEDSEKLYGRWAETYDEDFVNANSYVYHQRVADLLLAEKSGIGGPVLDVGCGTGIVGVALHDGGLREIDGIDIAPEMLARAADKTGDDGERAYRKLIRADLTQHVPVDDGVYGGIVSSGTFTHGHLGPESLDELWRMAAPGAVCAIGINASHYDLLGFGEKFAADCASGRISDPEFHEVEIYAQGVNSADEDHSSDTALVAVLKVN